MFYFIYALETHLLLLHKNQPHKGNIDSISKSRVVVNSWHLKQIWETGIDMANWQPSEILTHTVQITQPEMQYSLYGILVLHFIINN